MYSRIIRGTSKNVSIIVAIGIIMFVLAGTMTSLAPEYQISSSSVNGVATSLAPPTFIRLFGYENRYFMQAIPTSERDFRYSSILFESITNIDWNDLRSLFAGEIPGYDDYTSEILISGEGTDYTTIPYESAPPLELLLKEKEAVVQNVKEKTPKKVPKPIVTTNGKKVVYIYNTHTHESYLPHLKDVKNPSLAQNSKVNVVNVSEHLASALESQGIGSRIEKTDFISYMTKNGINYARAYDTSRKSIVTAMKNNRDLTYFIDIHRDSNRRNVTTTKIKGESYARISFIIGGENVHYKKNLELATTLRNMLEKKYPGLVRGVFEKKGSNTNGKFNQDISENAMLIEFGGVDNNLEELYRTSDAIADIFSAYYWQAEKVDAKPKAKKQ